MHDELIANTQADSQMVAAFGRGEVNATPAFIVQTNERIPGGFKYRAADPTSAKIIASAKESGATVNTMAVPENRLGAIRVQQKTGGTPNFVRLPSRTGGGVSDVGNLVRISTNEVRGGRATASQRSIDSAARSIRQNGGRFWVPIAVRQTGLDSYTPVGNANALAAARRAGSDVWAYIVAD